MAIRNILEIKAETTIKSTCKKYLPVLKDECSEILDIYKECGEVIWRGTKGGLESPEGFTKIIPRTDRKPKDSPMDFHLDINFAFYQKFGWNARTEGVFATTRYEKALLFGWPFIFFPANGFKYIWSRDIDDLYVRIRDQGILHHPDIVKKDVTLIRHLFAIRALQKPNDNDPQYEKTLDKNIEKYGEKRDRVIKKAIAGYKDYDIESALKLGGTYEFVFKCKYYYLMHINWNDIDKFIKIIQRREK